MPFLFSSQMTPLDLNMKNLCKLLKKFCRSFQMAQKLNRHLPNWFESGDLNLNIATVDFLTPDLTTVLVNQNKVSC